MEGREGDGLDPGLVALDTMREGLRRALLYLFDLSPNVQGAASAHARHGIRRRTRRLLVAGWRCVRAWFPSTEVLVEFVFGEKLAMVCGSFWLLAGWQTDARSNFHTAMAYGSDGVQRRR